MLGRGLKLFGRAGRVHRAGRRCRRYVAGKYRKRMTCVARPTPGHSDSPGTKKPIAMMGPQGLAGGGQAPDAMMSHYGGAPTIHNRTVPHCGVRRFEDELGCQAGGNPIWFFAEPCRLRRTARYRRDYARALDPHSVPVQRGCVQSLRDRPQHAVSR